MKDFFGQELKVGDYVAIERPKYRELTTAVVVSFTPQKVRVAYNLHYQSSSVEHIDPKGKSWNYLFLIDPRAVIKAPNQ